MIAAGVDGRSVGDHEEAIEVQLADSYPWGHLVPGPSETCSLSGLAALCAVCTDIFS